MRKALITTGTFLGIAFLLLVLSPASALAQEQGPPATPPTPQACRLGETYANCVCEPQGVNSKCTWTGSDNETRSATYSCFQNNAGDQICTLVDDQGNTGRDQQVAAQGGTVQAAEGCGPLNFTCLPGMLFSGIALLFLMLSGALLTVAGTVFNWVVIRTVFQFGTYFGTSDGMLVAWGIMRDISNIGLLFGFIFMGVMLILNVEGGGHGHGGGISAKRAIPRLIIFAVLLNFSLFASQAVIDVANAFSSSFATLAGEQCTTTTTTSEDPEGGQSVRDCINVGIAGQIMAAAGMTKLFSIDAMKDGFSNIRTQPYQYTLSLIMLSVFVLVTAVVLLAGAIMLIIRVVILSLLMVTSPIGFAGMVIPGLSGLASRWWKTLISQSFFAPVYLLLIFISIKLTEGLMQGDATLADAIIANQGNTVAGNMQVVMVFLIVIGFMIASLIAATKMGAMGASFATNSASALVFGAAARGTNYVAGGGARALRVAQQRTGIGGRAGQVAVNRVLRPIEKANLDARVVVPGLKTGLGMAGISAGAKPAEHATYADMVHQFSDIKSRTGGQKLQEQYEKERKTKELEDHAHGTVTDNDKMFLSTLSTKELESLHGIKEGVQQIAESLSSDQFEALMKSDNLTELEKGKLKTARYKTLTDAATSGNATQVKDIIKNSSKKDLENLPSTTIMQPLVLDNLKDSQRDDLVKSDKRSPAEKSAIKASYASEVLKEEFKKRGVAAVTAHPKFNGLSTGQYSKLGVDILSQPAIAAGLPPAVLDKIVKEDELDSTELRRLGAAMETAITAGTASPGVVAYMNNPSKAALYK